MLLPESAECGITAIYDGAPLATTGKIHKARSYRSQKGDQRSIRAFALLLLVMLLDCTILLPFQYPKRR